MSLLPMIGLTELSDWWWITSSAGGIFLELKVSIKMLMVVESCISLTWLGLLDILMSWLILFET